MRLCVLWLGALLVFACDAGEAKNRRCTQAVDAAEAKLGTQRTQMYDRTKTYDADKERKKVKDATDAASSACAAAKAPNARDELGRLGKVAEEMRGLIDKEVDKRKETDPGGERRGPAPKVSQLDGSVAIVEREVKARMKAPDTYKHIDTRVDGVGDRWRVTTTYEGANGFGAVGRHTSVVWIQNGEIVEFTR